MQDLFHPNFAELPLRTLVLENFQLRHLPGPIAQLTNLEELCLSGNDLYHLSEGLWVQHLQLLQLNQNSFWQIPPVIAQCIDLRSLSLSNSTDSHQCAQHGVACGCKALHDDLTQAGDEVRLDATFVQALSQRDTGVPPKLPPGYSYPRRVGEMLQGDCWFA